MKRVGELVVVVLVALLIGQPMLAMAGGAGRVIPNGKVSLISDGKEVKQFQSEIPLQDGIMMACSGNCIVQTSSMQLIAQDKAVFAMRDAGSSSDLTVKTGRVDFAIRGDAKPVAFHTPHDLVRTEQIIVPAGSNGLVRGYVNVSKDKSELAVTEGALQVVSSDGTQLIQSGNMITLAQANMGQDNSNRKELDGNPNGNNTATHLGGTGGGFLSKTTLIVGGVMLAGAGIGVAVAASIDDDSIKVSGE